MRIFGTILVILGVILQPIGWMYFTWLTAASIIAVVIGVMLIFADRHAAAESGDSGPFRFTGREMPGDIHGYSGQESGGRSTSWESSQFSDTGGSNDMGSSGDAGGSGD